MSEYIAPEFELDAFTCPHCGVYAQQIWCSDVRIVGRSGYFEGFQALRVNTCAKCEKDSIWFKGKMLFPNASVAPLASEDMPDDMKVDFIEAREIVNRSPRAACALLRLVLQKLMIYLGGKGKNINEDIGNLVKKGLPVKIQQALDSVRVIGNNAIHPGEIDLKDDTPTAISLFELINIIIEVMITQPEKVEDIYKKIPNGAKEAISKRDVKKY